MITLREAARLTARARLFDAFQGEAREVWAYCLDRAIGRNLTDMPVLGFAIFDADKEVKQMVRNFNRFMAWKAKGQS